MPRVSTCSGRSRRPELPPSSSSVHPENQVLYYRTNRVLAPVRLVAPVPLPTPHRRLDGPIAVTEPVIMEVLAGARTDARKADLRRLLLRFHLYQFDAAADFEGAARIYRRCRQAGITPRGLVDCMIAAVARRHEATLLACDIDLDRVARVIGIELDRPATPEGPSPAR
jgi:predicted nucleic acid-binding protein